MYIKNILFFILVLMTASCINTTSVTDILKPSKNAKSFDNLKKVRVIFGLESSGAISFKNTTARVLISDTNSRGQFELNNKSIYPVQTIEIKQGLNIIDVPIGKYAGIVSVSTNPGVVFCDNFKLPLIKATDEDGKVLRGYSLKVSGTKNKRKLNLLKTLLNKPDSYKISYKVSKNFQELKSENLINLNENQIYDSPIENFPLNNPCSKYKDVYFSYIPIKGKK